MARSPHDSKRLGVLVALILMVFGGLLRGWAATWGFISDEVCWIHNGGPYGNWATAETAVNPPALRMVLTAITTDHWQIAHLGRAWSFSAATAAIGLMFWLGRLVGQNKNIPGFLAAFYLMLWPVAIQQGGLFRSYATLQVVVLWHLIALVKVVGAGQRPTERSWIAHLVASTALLPQVHYVGVPIVFLEGLTFAVWLRDHRFIRYYVPAGLLFAPLGYRIISDTSQRLVPEADWMNTLRMLFQVSVDHPVLLVLAVLCWVRLQSRQRILLLAAASSAVGLIATASYHSARGDLGIIPALYQIPLMATLPLLLSTSRWFEKLGRVLGWLAVLGWFFVVAKMRLFQLVLRPLGPQGPPALAPDVKAGNWPDDLPTYVHPSNAIQPLYFYLEHERLLKPCPVAEGPICFDYHGRVFMSFDHTDLPPSRVVVFFTWNEEELFGEQCSLARFLPPYWVWDCPNGWKAP